MHRSIFGPIAFAALAVALAAPAPALADEPKTAEAVIAADNAWLDAEVRGDAAALERLLMPGYRSIGTAGQIRTGAELIANARRRGADPAMAESVARWQAAHPVRPEVTMSGDTAVLTWMVSGERGGTVSSCDIFVYVDGRWRAIYSQHSTATS